MSTLSAPIALIVVHGVADQRRGATGEAVATHLALELGGSVTRSDVPLRVPLCEPAVKYSPWDTDGWRKIVQAINKSWRHALRSDFLDPRLGGADSKRAAPKTFNKVALANSANGKQTVSADVRFSDYLFAKAYAGRNSKGGGSPEAPVHTVARFDLSAAPDLTVFEMYWADLSRLSGSAPRVLSELFTLLFDLVRVGRHAVSMHAELVKNDPKSMTWVGRLLSWADHLYSRALAMLTLQFVLCALVIFAASLVDDHASGLAYAGCAVVGIGIAAFSARVPREQSWLYGSVVGFSAATGLAWLVNVLPEASPSPLVGALLVVILTLIAWLYWRLLNYWEQRFRAVLGFGLVFGLVTALLMTWGIVEHEGFLRPAGWMAGALRAVEIILLVQISLWCLLAVTCVAAIVVGWWAGRSEPGSDAAENRRQVIRTGRLGLFLSIGAFLVLMMALWALFKNPLREALGSTLYTPFIGRPMLQSEWLDERFVTTTGTFALIAILLSVPVGFIALVLAPCIAVDMGRPIFKGSEISGWLTRGYRALEGLLGWGSWVVAIGILLAAAHLLANPQCLSWLGGLSKSLLENVVVAIAGTTTGLIAIGGVTLKWLQALRAPLDAALDVDVHFREFPRAAIPRVLIAERYVALLEHIVQRGYRRIVIVAHSQGCVITAEVLRYLRQRPELLDGVSCELDTRLGKLGAALKRMNVDLLTVGCPLRQLYAQRFPSLYGWARDPKPQQLGLTRWFNAWGGADYVGRWLWSSAQSGLAEDPAGTWRDECIGSGAHTHYFDAGQERVRRQLLALLSASTQRPA